MRFLILLALLVLPVPGHAQSSEIRAALLPLMAMDCGVGQTAIRFGRIVGSNPAEARTLFLEVVRAGASETVRAEARETAGAVFDRSYAWAERNAEKPHARRWLKQADRAAYVEQAERDSDLRYRSNALAGLRMVGQPADRQIIVEVVRDRPRLSVAGERALTAIARR